MHINPRQAGFTVLELMLTIAVAAVIVGIGVPNLREAMRNTRMSGAANDLMASIYSARSEAVKLHMPTIICFSSDPTADMPVCDGDGNQGWIAFVDDQDPAVAAATDNNGQVDAGERVLERHAPLDRVTVHVRPAGGDGYVSFGPSGFARPHEDLGDALEGVVFCDERGNVDYYGPNTSAARLLAISGVGRPIVTRATAEIAAEGGCP